MLRVVLLTSLIFLTASAASPILAQAVLVNVNSAAAAPLADAIKEKGLATTTAKSADAIDPATRLVVWEAHSGADISPDQAKQLGEIVRKGGSLLLTFSPSPGITPMRLSFMLPTMPWHTTAAGFSRGGVRPGVSVLNWDASLFPDAAPKGLVVPFHFEIEPLSAVERGMERYEPFVYHIDNFDLKHQPGEFFWTRPLLNREWTTRFRGNDGPQTPLLITGRYGAGRVAVFASSAGAVTAANHKVWSDLLGWLTTPPPAAAPSSPLDLDVSSTPSTNAHGKKSLQVTVHNPSGSSVSGSVIVRFLTWQEAMIQDPQNEQVAFTVGPQAKTTLDIPLPEPGPTGYQELDFRDAFDVRVGVLSADQTTLLAEARQQVDADPPLALSVQTDNLRAFTYPFTAPDQNALGSFRTHMGMPVMAYAYKPGQTVNATVTLANGVRNLAALATADDETQPGNATVSALTQDSSQAEKGTRGGFGACGMWIGQAGVENVLKFTFPQPVWLSAVVLNGNSINYRRYLSHNPGAVSIECDGKEIAKDDHLDDHFLSGNGLARLEFPPIKGQVVRIHLPWVSDKPGSFPGGYPRAIPYLGGVILEGSTAEFPPAQQGTIKLTLSDSLSGTETSIGKKDVTVSPGATKVVPFSFALPAGISPAFYQLKASFQGQQKAVPILAISPTQTLLPISQIHPDKELGMNFIVTGGFRNASAIGVGQQQALGSWGNPDDLVWAFDHGLKQTNSARVAPAGMLFAINADLGHYANPWTCFRNGEMFFTVAAPHFLDTLKKRREWATTDHIGLGFSDRWDSGPSMNNMYTWQDLVGFDQYLRGLGKPGLKGQTHGDLCREIDTQYDGLWQNWQMNRYVQNVETLRKTFAAEGKTAVISGQGLPLMPAAAGKIIAQTVRGMSDDNTWGMWDEDIAKTTGRQLACMAYDPYWALGSNFVWGWNSAILNNSYWYAPVGTTEPSRRHYSDRAWRATIDGDGHYRSMFTYGYGMNGGTSYCMNQNDWQQNWLMQERHSLIYPDGPIGAGMIIGTSAMDNPDTAQFSGGGMGDSPAQDLINGIAPIFGELTHAGLSVPFMASAASLDQWKGDAPLIVADLSVLSDTEIGILKKRIDAGTHVAAFQGAGAISAAAAALFAVHADGTPDGGDVVGLVNKEPTTDKVPVVAHGVTLFIPGDANNLSSDDMGVLSPILTSHLDLPLRLPEGTAGYGFTDGGLSCVVVEDWLDQGRTVSVRVHAGAGKSAHAVNVNDHEPLQVHRDGGDWVVELPLRPGDGALIALSESP